MTTTTDIRTDRERLIQLADHYVAALGARAPERLNVAPGLKVTENTQSVALGAGLWRTCRSVSPGGHYFVDPEAGQVAYWGVLEELRGTAIFGVRLQAAGRSIAAIETVVVRGGDVFVPEVVLAEFPEMHAIVPVDERVSRAELIAGASAYFDGIELSDGDRIPMRANTRRLVNGVGDTSVDPGGLEEDRMYLSMDVSPQITAGHYSYIEAIRDRRFPIVDEERGLCHTVIVFDHPGDLPQPNGKLPFGSPNSMIIFEAFKMTREGIGEVWAIGTSVPYGTRSGWN
jgi:hypothetical protein